MRYRSLGRTGLHASEIGLGCEHLQGKSFGTVDTVVKAALDNGINIMDIFMSEPEVRSNLGRALAGRRGSVLIQGHIGSAWLDGQYCRTRSISECKRFFEDLLARLQTNYIDIGMIHFVDSQQDYEAVFHAAVIEYAQELKQRGVIRAIGMSSHNPQTALKAVKTGLLDVLMFSINPAYDILPEDTPIDDLFEPRTYQADGLTGANSVRERLYQTCESMGTGITVMKSMGAGVLLNKNASPFGEALTPVQCIHYALTRPGVASVLAGCQTFQEVQDALLYETADAGQKDYSPVLSMTPHYSMRGRCMYCNHCLPCPSKIDIARVNQYLDIGELEEDVPATVREHYFSLGHLASDCVECGSCEQNCPFGVPVRDRMKRAAALFEK